MFLAILTRAQSLLFRFFLLSFLPMPIGIVLFAHYASTHGPRFDADADISAWGPLVLIFVPIAFLILWVILLLTIMAARHADLLSTEPAVGEVISVKPTKFFVNNVPELAVKMRVKGRNLVTECRVLGYLGPTVGDVYNIRISRFNPAVAKIVYS